MTLLGNEPAPRYCAECGKPFQGRNSRAKFCGQDCNHLAYRKRNREKLSKRSMDYARNRRNNGLLTAPGKAAPHDANAGTDGNACGALTARPAERPAFLPGE